MALQFAYTSGGTTTTQTINGTVQSVTPYSAQSRARRTHHWGTVGETEIVSERGGRVVEALVLLHNSYSTVEDLHEALQEYDAMLCRHGTLTNTAGSKGTYPNCTFIELIPVPLARQQSNGPLYDDVGTLDSGWFQQFLFRWYQLLTSPNGRTPA